MWFGSPKTEEKIEQERQYMLFFVPKEDISTYELAKILSLVSNSSYMANGIQATQTSLDALPQSIKRHFEITEKSDR